MPTADKNNGNHTSMPYQAIIVLCLVGAGAACLCAWAMARHYFPENLMPSRGDNVGPDGLSQAQYMRTVRLRNQEDLQRKYGHLNGYVRPKPMPMDSMSSF